MEEDIKIIEELIKAAKDYNQYEGNKYYKSIENLIARYKELEAENLKYERANDYLSSLNRKYYEDNVTLLRKNGKVDVLADDIHFKYIDMVDNYIPKSKVREKMNKDINTNEHTILGGRRNGKTLEYGIRLGRIQMCEELLQEGDDK